MKFENFLSENYSFKENSNSNVSSEIIKQNIGKLFKLRNDMVFLHISVKGSNFGDLHSLLNEYYTHLDYDIDALLELYVGIFKKSFNLNEFNSISDDNDKSVFRIKKVLGEILSVLDKLKSEFRKLENDAINSKLDGIAEYFFKQYTFIIDGYISDIHEDEGAAEGSSEGSAGTTSGDIATVDNRFPEIVKRKKRKI